VRCKCLLSLERAVVVDEGVSARGKDEGELELVSDILKRMRNMTRNA